MAAWTRLAVLASAAVLALAGCTYRTQEPGLFPSPRPSGEASSPTTRRFPPQQTNPRLPVAGERIWVSGGQIPVTMRIAVHAVRRVQGATVLDWSVTPLTADGFRFGDGLPGIELGLDRPSRGNHDPAVSLLEADTGRVYRALTHESRRLSNHCLCTPTWYLAQDMRIGETRLLQAAYPPLPAATDFVDVNIATLTPFSHVPVTAVGSAPVAGRPTNLARPAESARPLPQHIEFANPIESRQRQRIQVNRVWAAPGWTALEWTLRSITDQDSNRILEYGPPIAAPRPLGDIYLVNTSPASGPVLVAPTPAGVKPLTTTWVATERNDIPAYECLCTELGLWSRGLQDAGRSVTLITNYPKLPPGTRTVDVGLPGFGTFRKVPVTAVDDSARRLQDPEPAETGLWTYSLENPPRGWPTADWPTDTPDPTQLSAYRPVVETVRPLPGQ